jgi:NAD(P)-dependent dehydrogenase (short-subunit alcohol dehydrogenase family)
MGITYSNLFPPKAEFTEEQLEPQHGKVFIVTGGYSGAGYELSRILYQAGGAVYVAGRSEEKAKAAIAKIEGLESPRKTLPGKLVFLDVKLDDLRTVKPAVERFLKMESRLDVLFNNAGVSHPPTDWRSAQGHEMQIATNCLGPYLLTKLLMPILRTTAETDGVFPGSVRVVFTSSITTDTSAPKGGMNIATLDDPSTPQTDMYTHSKTGNWFLANTFQAHLKSANVLCVAQNPGNLRSSLLRHFNRPFVYFLHHALLYAPVQGANTELFAGLSGELGMSDGGCHVLPFGRRHPSPREDLLEAMRDEENGGNGVARKFEEWCDEKTREFC